MQPYTTCSLLMCGSGANKKNKSERNYKCTPQLSKHTTLHSYLTLFKVIESAEGEHGTKLPCKTMSAIQNNNQIDFKSPRRIRIGK